MWDKCENNVRSMWDQCETSVKTTWGQYATNVRPMWERRETHAKTKWEQCARYWKLWAYMLCYVMLGVVSEMVCYVITYCVMSMVCCVMFGHVMLFQCCVMLWFYMSRYNNVVSRYLSASYSVLCYDMSCSVMLCSFILWYVMLCYDMLWHVVVLWYGMLCYVMLLRCVMLCYGMVCCVNVTLWHVSLSTTINKHEHWNTEWERVVYVSLTKRKNTHTHLYVGVLKMRNPQGQTWALREEHLLTNEEPVLAYEGEARDMESCVYTCCFMLLLCSGA